MTIAEQKAEIFKLADDLLKSENKPEKRKKIVERLLEIKHGVRKSKVCPTCGQEIKL